MSFSEQGGLQVDVPQEIFDLIIHQNRADRSTLYNLCLVSSSFLPQARRTLYQALNISDDKYALYSGWLIDAERALGLFHTLTEYNPSLAKYAKDLYHRLASSDSSAGDLYWDLLKRSLQLMVNLKRLTITCINPMPDLFTGCSFRLEVFGCDRPCDSSVIYNSTLQHLSTQPNLRSLYAWRFYSHTAQFPDEYCMDLEALTGDRRTIEEILPGRSSITRLTWIPDTNEDITSPPSTNLVNELANLRVLSLGGYYRRPSLKLVIPYLISVEVLRLFGETRELNLYDEFALIPQLPSLKIFIWTAGFATSVKWTYFGQFGDHEAGTDAQRLIVKDWFDRSRTLETAYFHSHQPRLAPQCYLRWKRGDEEPVAVGYEEAVESNDVVSWYS